MPDFAQVGLGSKYPDLRGRKRRDRSFLRMGCGSILVLIAYTGGVVILYTLRPGG